MKTKLLSRTQIFVSLLLLHSNLVTAEPFKIVCNNIIKSISQQTEKLANQYNTHLKEHERRTQEMARHRVWHEETEKRRKLEAEMQTTQFLSQFADTDIGQTPKHEDTIEFLNQAGKKEMPELGGALRTGSIGFFSSPLYVESYKDTGLSINSYATQASFENKYPIGSLISPVLISKPSPKAATIQEKLLANLAHPGKLVPVALVVDIETPHGIKRKWVTEPEKLSQVVRAAGNDHEVQIFENSDKLKQIYPVGSLKDHALHLYHADINGGWTKPFTLQDMSIRDENGKPHFVRISQNFGPKISKTNRNHPTFSAGVGIGAIVIALAALWNEDTPLTSGVKGGGNLGVITIESGILENANARQSDEIQSITISENQSGEPDSDTTSVENEAVTQEGSTKNVNTAMDPMAQNHNASPETIAMTQATTQGNGSTKRGTQIPPSAPGTLLELARNTSTVNDVKKQKSFFGISTENAGDILFVVDTSGSMDGIKIEALRSQLANAIDNIEDGCYFNILPFNTWCQKQYEKMQRKNKIVLQDVKESVSKLISDGNTNFDRALIEANKQYDSLENSQNYRSIYFLSDGQSNSTPDRSLISSLKAKGVVIHTIALGSGNEVDVSHLKHMASETGGYFVHIEK